MSLFRPIAIAPPKGPADMDVYAANSPRRAKRLRSESGAAVAIAPQSDIHRPSSPFSSDDQVEDDGYDTPPPAPQPKRRGRKPGTLSRAAREAQRKINHSLIEKARRTKINDALAALRELVPPEYKRVNETVEGSDEDDDDEPKKGKGKSKAGEKEFKLEILVRTVAYLRDLTEKVRHLEEDGCPNCKQCARQSSSDTRGLKRRRQDVEPNEVEEEKGARTKVGSAEDPSSRLPSISTWLPHPSQERTRRAPLLSSSQSPSGAVPSSSKSPSQQLPTPPTSATFTSSSSVFGVPPVLTLPSPSAILPQSGTQIQPCFSGFVPRRSSIDTSSSSPVYTPEDETAASLLLRISTSTPVTSPQLPLKQASPSSKMSDSRAGRPGEESVHALTPSHLLGLTTGT
ncbi:uncharacterized protein EDB91DRAFT_1132837 [Suillus paluster]|uniref:uncharacterized protein n=1 Tax=Suillus paluster TaxID=48578 RepID=UPI001B85F4D7|nr:uncharacterized protein EDB91DRAFT_1132837 [Suillus paluster]KAG1740504.1 hypothetical protein EDB91DRAFT_1132837 [Suillus paluster]